MSTVQLGPATIRYETYGDGPAVLLLAPGGLRASRIETWGNAPWNPIEALRDRFRVVAMDQRNTGTSFAPVTAGDGWDDYAADQLGLMDHLGIDRFAVVGMCIGGAFIAKLLVTAPERVTAAVAMQPIGLDDNRDDVRRAVRGVARRRPRRSSGGERRRLVGREGQPVRSARTTCGASPTTRCRRSIARCSSCAATTSTTRRRRRSGWPPTCPAPG